MLRRLGGLVFVSLLAVPTLALAQGEDAIPPPPGPAPGERVAPPPGPTGGAAQLAAPGADPGAPGAAGGATSTELAIEPILAAASADLAAQRPALGYARASFVIEVLPEGAPLRVRAEGLRVLATQRIQPGEPPPSIDEVLSPLVVQADLDLRAGQPLLALPRLDLALGRLPPGSPLRARAEQMRGFAISVAPQGSVSYAPAPYAPAFGGGVYQPAAPPPAAEPVDPTRRGTGEMVELYITAGLYGVLTGAYIPFVATDEEASETAYVLTMIGGGAVMAVSVLLLDLAGMVRTGVAPTISSSIRFGFANGMLSWGLIEAADESSSVDPASAFSLVWGGATLGAVVGASLGFGLQPSVRDERFVESVGIWGGLWGTSIAMITDYQDPAVGLALSLVGLDVGILTGAVIAGTGNAPSVTRTLLIDLGVLAGAGIGALGPLIYYAYADDVWELEAFGLGMLIGSLGGFALMVGLTHGMDDESAPDPAAASVSVGLSPLEGGGALSVSGAF